MKKIIDGVKQEASNFIEKTVSEIIEMWASCSTRAPEDQKRAVQQYYDLFVKDGKQYFNLKATPKADPIETRTAWNRELVMSTSRYNRYGDHKFEPFEVKSLRNGEFQVRSVLHAEIDGWAYQAPIVHVLKKTKATWKIVRTLEMEVEPGHAAYDSVFCQWLLPQAGSFRHMGQILARFSKYFVKYGFSASFWEKQPQIGAEGKPAPKFGIIAQHLLTAYLFGSLPPDWQVLHNSPDGRAEIDIKLIQPGEDGRREKIYYIESKASAFGNSSQNLTQKEKDQIDRISPAKYEQYHIVRFGLKEHTVRLQKHRLPDGQLMDVTVWHVKHS